MPYLRSVVAVLVLATFARAGEVRTISGKAYSGDVLGVTETELKVMADGKEVAIPITDLLSADLQPLAKPIANQPYVQTRLTDGTVLKGQALGLKGKNAEMRLFSGQAFQFPTACLHSVLFDAQDEKNRADFEKELNRKVNQDVLRLLSRDGMAINMFEGFVGDADEKGEAVQFKSEGNTVSVNVARIRGIIFSRKPDDKAPAPVCRLYDNSENVLLVQKLTSTPQGFKVTTPAGVELELPRATVARLDFSLGKVAFLSDLEPLSVDVNPILAADLLQNRAPKDRYGRDKNLYGGPISLRQKAYSKGLAVHSRTVLVFDVKGYNSFQCVLGIDDLVSDFSHAVVRLEGDGKELFNAEVTSRDDPRDVKVNISGTNQLRVIVDYGKYLDLGDHVDLAEAKVTK